MASAIKGRGALSQPPGRFDKLTQTLEHDGWYEDEEPKRRETIVMPEPARSIISRNQSPDIHFSQSINPYRGCEHGCVYCMAGDTQILMADGTTKMIADVEVGDAIYGTERVGTYRRYVKTKVLAHWSVIKSAFRVTLEDGTTLVTGADHRFLTERGWKFVTGYPGRDPTRAPHHQYQVDGSRALCGGTRKGNRISPGLSRRSHPCGRLDRFACRRAFTRKSHATSLVSTCPVRR